jgi:hypothetical protein
MRAGATGFGRASRDRSAVVAGAGTDRRSAIAAPGAFKCPEPNRR